MSMKVDRKAAVKKLRTLVLGTKGDVEPFKATLEEKFGSVFLPNQVELYEKEYGQVKCDLLVPDVYSSHKIILYIHGGSFVGGSRASYRSFCASLANESSCRVVVPEFRLAPTNPFPASIDDLVSVFRVLYAENQVLSELEQRNTGGRKYEPQIVIAADGSGASLAMALIFKIKDLYINGVRNIVFFSPWLDLSGECKLIADKRCSDEVLTGAEMHRAVDLYTFASNISNPLVSALRADDEAFKGLPPFYIQLGEKEILKQQAEELKEKLDKAGVECIVDVWENMMFMFQMADEYLRESHLAVEKVGDYISKRDALNNEEEEERQKILRKNDIVV